MPVKFTFLQRGMLFWQNRSPLISNFERSQRDMRLLCTCFTHVLTAIHQTHSISNTPEYMSNDGLVIPYPSSRRLSGSMQHPNSGHGDYYWIESSVIYIFQVDIFLFQIIHLAQKWPITCDIVIHMTLILYSTRSNQKVVNEGGKNTKH